MASVMPAAHAHSTDQGIAGPVVRSEPLATLTLQLQLAAPEGAACGNAAIVGGQAAGTLAGTVLPGILEWSRDTERGTAHLALRYGLQTADGHRLQVIDRASFPCTGESAWSSPISTSTELEAMADPMADVLQEPAAALVPGITVGRLDASALGTGRLRLELHRVI
jgi:hypothetical protein